jgi:hypothetical protein
MEFIDMRFIMNRLLDSPIMAQLKLSSAASYVKDFSSINGICPILDYGWTYSYIVNYRAELPTNVGDIVDMYLCKNSVTTTDFPVLDVDNRISATMKTSKIPNSLKRTLGTYIRKGNAVDTDIPDGTLEIYHSCMRVDEQGFPLLPYDGSLMEAIINYIKFRYFTILHENDMISKDKKQEAHSEYSWYIGQYTMKNTIPTYDEAVAWANSWQRLLKARDIDPDLNIKSFPQHLNF